MSRHRIPLLLATLTLSVSLACNRATSPEPFRTVAVIDVGRNPHQIAFSEDGRTAWVAAAGSDRITAVDVASRIVIDTLGVPDSPLGVAILPGDGLAVTRFGADEIIRFPSGGKEPDARLTTGGAPSLFAGPLPDGTYLVSVEQADRVWLFDPATFALPQSYDTGDRPFPAAATSDGRLIFVPNYNDGTVTVIDHWNDRVVATVPVGEHPSGGVVFPEDIVYAVAVRGANRVALINTASFTVTDTISAGIGEEPFSVVLAPNGRLAFVNNTASHDVSVIDVAGDSVLTRLPVGEQPIVMAVHPSGATLWVSSEGSHELAVIEIPEAWRGTAAVPSRTDEPATVAVMGMIHDQHPTSTRWGFAQLEETIRTFKPDIVCAEIPPNRWERVWTDYTERGVVVDPRVVRFPEYNDFMLRLSRDMGFTIVPCAAWTKEMSDLRERRIEAFETQSAWAGRKAEYDRRVREALARFPEPAHPDDPHYIHSDAYDQRTRAELSLYDEYQNDLIGPGGWTNINEGHLRLINRTIAQHPGERILITFGAGHKYWFLDRLKNRDDVRLVDLEPYLPAQNP